MTIQALYCKMTKARFSEFGKAQKWIRRGASLQHFRWKYFPDRSIPSSLQALNRVVFQYLAEPLCHPARSAYVNLFAPCEILHAFDLYPMFVESLATFLNGFSCEDLAVDQSESSGLSETLCSFHKTFIGGAERGALPKPLFAMASSVLCDANTKTFLHVAKRLGIPALLIDVPYTPSPEAVRYVSDQLQDVVKQVEDISGKPFRIDRLREVLALENETKRLMAECLEALALKAFPNHLTLEMGRLMLTHTGIGRPESSQCFQALVRDIRNAPPRSGKAIFWIQVIPFFDPTLRARFNYASDYQLLGMDINFDDLEPLPLDDPLFSLAKKIVNHVFNGPFNRRIDWILGLMDRLKPDGVVYFCQWGCKQSSGGAAMMADALKTKGIPCLVLDGDAADRRNMPQGQTKTRVEAFLEMLP
ncbi:MAG TPA: 2-hydroxyacyl-CoA dehydratase family protein [Thermotogota bacterium]|nr:2-hydroxyacyl-CoA dehydratase [Thermotogota bacterium]NLH18494.1 2-hydroxyacyl-CoA dehydratase [Thermotogaceae bacterium]OQC31664.1 MAG: R-phenyllactate dehydratase subunit alpha precursor [Thermotogota bacterium ADurb.Bin062]HNY81469.1 2-hydroxyacyl-CoA dehydratase family protein [Thermotogota bacterium]HOD90595.1 2-hydroxyacyl-CoA dehydratase family protein [Thermotogota bacterium]